MQDIAIIEEAIEILPRIGRAFAASPPGGGLSPLSRAQSRAVTQLYHSGDLTIGEFAAGLGIGMPAASELIDRLAEQGLVSRTTDPSDRRRAIVSLTPAALDHAHQIHDQRRAQVRAALDQLEPEEHAVFLKALRALASAVGASEST
jgi:DNA-binding MarR family transcriptional regulator